MQGLHPETVEATEDVPLDKDSLVGTLATEAGAGTEDTLTTATTVTDSTAPSVSFEDNDLQDQDEKPVKFGKIIDPHVLGCCEYCGGPVKRRRFCSPLKRFCSKGCSRSSRRANLKVCDISC